MNVKLFARDDNQAHLQDLYRAAEEGRDLRGVDPDVQRTFAADQQFLRQLERLAARSGSVHAAIGRATLLAEIARGKSQSPVKEPGSMIGQLLTGRALALLATAGIFAGGAATVAASGGVSGAAGNVQNVLAALHITARTPDTADTHLNGVQQPDGSGKPGDAANATPGAGLANATQHASDNAQHGLQNATEAAGNAGQGIDNAAPQGLDHANSHATDGPSSNAPSGTPTVVPPTPASGRPSDGTVPLPTQASQHAPDGAGNASGH